MGRERRWAPEPRGRIGLVRAAQTPGAASAPHRAHGPAFGGNRGGGEPFRPLVDGGGYVLWCRQNIGIPVSLKQIQRTNSSAKLKKPGLE